jgi:two-component system, LuxR family, response regulator FixJ
MDTKRTILVLDDDSAVRDSLKFSLGIEGFDVHTYSDAEELLNDNLLLVASCLIVDHHMTTMNGLQVAAKVRDRRGSMPVILVTGHPDADIRGRAAAAGVALIEKPFRGTLLIDCIHAALNGDT